MTTTGITPEDLEYVSTQVSKFGHGTYFLSGSLSAGLGHRRSDIDIHIIANEPTELEIGPAPSGRTVQLTNVRERELALYENFRNGVTITPEDRKALYLSDLERWDLFRLAVGVPLRVETTHEWMFSDALRGAVRQIQLGTFAHQIPRAWDDATGLMEVDELSCAEDIASMALRDAITMVLAAFGDYYASPKFFQTRLARAARTAPAVDSVLHAWSADLGLEEKFRLAQSLSARAQLSGWSDVVSANDPVGGWMPASGLYRRSLGYWLIRGSTSWSLSSPGTRGFAISRDLAVLWACSDSGEPTRIQQACERLGVTKTLDELGVGLSQLVEKEILTKGGD